MTVIRSRLAIALAAACAAVGLAAAGPLPAQAATIDTIARQAVLIDVTTDTVLLEKAADERMPTSSMSKLMTMYMVFEALHEGRLSLDDELPVSERAWRMQGSKMFVELHNNIKVEDLIRGVIIQSGNDACIVLAEALAGSEQAFAQKMTERAHEIGLSNSNFMNATGWPDPNHYSTAEDLATLARRLMSDFPEYYHFYSEKEFTYHNIKQGNRNPLLYRDMGVDGLKTGHTEAAGYGLTASGIRDGRRLVLVVNGLPDMQARADESARLIDWGYREFDAYPLFKAGEAIDEVPVWLGARDTVPVSVTTDLRVTLARADRPSMTVKLVTDSPVQAPIAKGDPVGRLVVSAPGQPDKVVPVVAAVDVPKLGFFGRALEGAKYMVFGTGS